MDTSKLSIKVNYEEPVYIDENTVKVGILINDKKSNDITLVHNGQVWKVEK